MAKAEIQEEVQLERYAEVTVGIVNWPMSVIRLRGKDRKRITELASEILTLWRGYSDPEVDLIAESNGEPHNTITPIARKRDD
ncbi:galactose-1-phosphate uridylyltransferase, partial [Planococcus sp. SIMBA_143]